jgi:hypothetical protein
MDLYVKEILVTKFRMRCQYLSGLNSVYYGLRESIFDRKEICFFQEEVLHI